MHWLTLAVSPPDCLLDSLTYQDKCPLSPRTIFSAMSDIGILINAHWQCLGRRAAILPPQIYPRVTFVIQEKETMETNRCGSETHLLSQIKNSSFKAVRRYWGWFLVLSMQIEVWLGTRGRGGSAVWRERCVPLLNYLCEDNWEIWGQRLLPPPQHSLRVKACVFWHKLSLYTHMHTMFVLFLQTTALTSCDTGGLAWLVKCLTIPSVF